MDTGVTKPMTAKEEEATKFLLRYMDSDSLKIAHANFEHLANLVKIERMERRDNGNGNFV